MERKCVIKKRGRKEIIKGGSVNSKYMSWLRQANLGAPMYGPPHASMNDTTNDQGAAHLDDDDDDNDVVQCSNGDDAVDNPSSQIRYDAPNATHSPHALVALDSVAPHPLYASDMPPPGPSSGDGGADQLTLSFQGEVYVFDSVSPEKVSLFFPFSFFFFFWNWLSLLCVNWVNGILCFWIEFSSTLNCMNYWLCLPFCYSI